MNILHFALNDLKITTRERVAFALVIILPIFMISLMGYALKPVFSIEDNIERFPILYANQDNGPIGKNIDEFLSIQANHLVEAIETSPEGVEAKILSEEYDVAVVIPNDLSDNITKGKNAKIHIVSSGKDPVKDGIIRSLVHNFTNALGSRMQIIEGYQEILPSVSSTEAAATVNASPYDNNTNFIIEHRMGGSLTRELSSFEYFSASMLIFFLLTTGMGIGTRILKDREDKTLLRIESFPIKKTEYLTGKTIANALIGILQALMVVVFTKYAFGVNWGSNYFGIGLTIILVVFISCGLGILFSSFVNSSKALTTVMTVLFWLMAFISGGFTATPILDPLPKFTINKWAFDALTTLMTGGTLESIQTHLVILVIISLLLWIGGITLYNRRDSHE